MSHTFIATIERGEKQDTMGIVVPPEVIEALGNGKRPRVIVQFDKSAYAYSYTVASMGGRFLIGIAKEHREPAGIRNQKQIEVTLTIDNQPRIVVVPEDLSAALAAAKVLHAFDRLSFTNRKEAVRLVEGAKTEPTRIRRIAKITEDLINATNQ